MRFKNVKNCHRQNNGSDRNTVLKLAETTKIPQITFSITQDDILPNAICHLRGYQYSLYCEVVNRNAEMSLVARKLTEALLPISICPSMRVHVAVARRPPIAVARSIVARSARLCALTPGSPVRGSQTSHCGLRPVKPSVSGSLRISIDCIPGGMT